jgi:hypothetical protein
MSLIASISARLTPTAIAGGHRQYDSDEQLSRRGAERAGNIDDARRLGQEQHPDRHVDIRKQHGVMAKIAPAGFVSPEKRSRGRLPAEDRPQAGLQRAE